MPPWICSMNRILFRNICLSGWQLQIVQWWLLMVTKYNRMPSLFLTWTSFNRNSNLANEDVQVKQLDVLEVTDVFGIAFYRTNTLEECTTGRSGIGTTRRLPLATDARMCQDVSNKSNASPVCSFENWKRLPCYLNTITAVRALRLSIWGATGLKFHAVQNPYFGDSFGYRLWAILWVTRGMS